MWIHDAIPPGFNFTFAKNVAVSVDIVFQTGRKYWTEVHRHDSIKFLLNTSKVNVGLEFKKKIVIVKSLISCYC